ncbi:MAG: GGDEF domain-containing protein [Lachnospiraceae bacterium]|nr:GGDEF domain-containing protein [Lachnospiraceae bacterium]
METEISEYSSFLKENRIKVNGYLNKALWFFVLTGPAIASGIKGGIFKDITYFTCINISVVIIIMALIHLLLLKKYPDKAFTCIFALTALNMLLAYMNYSHVSIYLTWFLVPLLSLLFCDRHLFFYSVISNYILMFITTRLTAPYEAALRTEHKSVNAYFANVISGFTIESVVMFASAYLIGKLTVDYFKSLFDQRRQIMEQEKAMEEKMGILDSMAEIYDNVNLIDFVNNTEMSLRDSEQKKHGIDFSVQTHTLMNQRIKNQVMPDQLDEFLQFTNIKTVRSRLAQKKLISADFIDIVSGWFRAQYITVDSTLDNIPNMVIYTTRNVDEEKRREEHLIRISMTDEMTRLFNRRCYDEDLREIRDSVLSDDFVLFSIDVNGLKRVNDTKGHVAGDELIKGAANCLALSVGNKGKVYRTGGDEFMAVVHTDDPEKVRGEIMKKASEWHGIYTDEVTMSVGYASHKANPEASVDDLERTADADMYAEKDRHYKERGIERRKH